MVSRREKVKGNVKLHVVSVGHTSITDQPSSCCAENRAAKLLANDHLFAALSSDHKQIPGFLSRPKETSKNLVSGSSDMSSESIRRRFHHYR